MNLSFKDGRGEFLKITQQEKARSAAGMSEDIGAEGGGTLVFAREGV